MFKYMYKLPDEIIIIISSYYPNKISNNLSNDINDLRLLYAIKEKEYYNKNTRGWNISKIGSILINQSYIPEKLKKLYKKSVWRDRDSVVNKMWNFCTHDQRIKIIDDNFKYAYESNPYFLTFRELFYSHFGFYINNNVGIYIVEK